MKNFAYLTHPRNKNQLNKLFPLSLLGIKQVDICKPKFQVSTLGEGLLFVLPLLAEDFFNLSQDQILRCIDLAGQLAMKKGCRIMGLGGSFSDAASLVKKRFAIPVTDACLLKAWTIIESVYRAAKFKKIDLKNATISIIGADSSLGSLCARRLSCFSFQLMLSGFNGTVIKSIKKKIDYELIEGLNFVSKRNAAMEVILEDDPLEAIASADIVIFCRKAGSAELDPELFKENAVVILDAEKNEPKKPKEKSAKFIYSGLMHLPQNLDINFDSSLPRGVVPASLAETLILAMGEKFVFKNLAAEENIDNLEEIANICVQLGFETYLPEVPVC